MSGMEGTLLGVPVRCQFSPKTSSLLIPLFEVFLFFRSLLNDSFAARARLNDFRFLSPLKLLGLLVRWLAWDVLRDMAASEVVIVVDCIVGV